MFSEVASFILDSVWVSQLAEKANFLENVLPLFQTLFPHVGHFLDSDNLLGENMTGIVYSTKATMTNFP